MMEIRSHPQLNFPCIYAIRNCTGCHQGKPLIIEQFYSHKSNRAGFDTRCRDCRNGCRRIWRAANSDRINGRRRELYALRKASVIKCRHQQRHAEQGDPAHSQYQETLRDSELVATHGAPLCDVLPKAETQLIKTFGIFAPAPLIVLPPVRFVPKSPMDHAATSSVVGKHGATSGVEHDARPGECPDNLHAGCASTFELPDIPDCLRRSRSAA